MDRIQNFYLQAYLSYRGLFHWLTPFPYFSNIVLAPFLTLLNFILIGRFASVGDVDHFGIGMVVYAIAWIYVGGVTQSFSNDRSGGTLHLLFGSPASRASAYFARGAGHFYNGPLTAISTTFLAVLVIDLNVADLNYLTYAVAIAVVSIGILMFSPAPRELCRVVPGLVPLPVDRVRRVAWTDRGDHPSRSSSHRARGSGPGASHHPRASGAARRVRRSVGGTGFLGPLARTGRRRWLRPCRARCVHADGPSRAAARHPCRR